MPTHYDAEVKAQAVRLVAKDKVEASSVTKSCEAVARRLGISKETLLGWCRQAQVDAGGARPPKKVSPREEGRGRKPSRVSGHRESQ